MHQQQIEQIRELTNRLNQWRHEYYNLNAPTVADAEYDKYFDELSRLEKETGFVMSNSPTQTVGYTPVSGLSKVRHQVPLLSLDKTKSIEDLLRFIGSRPALFMLKLDGLTVNVEYEGGRLVRASTRGDGNVGEDITHNARVFQNIPLAIPYHGRLVVTGEALIKTDDFVTMQQELTGSDGTTYKTARNLAAGSVRLFDPAECKKRCIRFYAFSVLEGLDIPVSDNSGAPLHIDPNSKKERLDFVRTLGFDTCRKFTLNIGQDGNPPPKVDIARLEAYIASLKASAEKMGFPIDGIVVTYDDVAYSRSLGSTGHHYRDGLAFKFGDETTETVFREIVWKPSRSGEISPVAIFDTVEIDGCEVSRASLHNLSFIKELEFRPDCRILVSKRNMIIPHVENNLDRGAYDNTLIPSSCPCCGSPTRVDTSGTAETLYCDNPTCAGQRLQQFVHFVSKKAMDIEGLSEATLERFISMGWLDDFMDVYRLDRYAREIKQTEGFGEKSWLRLWDAIERSRSTTFERYLISMDIPMIGRTASKELCRHFNGDLNALETAVDDGFDFTQLNDFGEVLDRNIHAWFRIEKNRNLWEELQKMINIEKTANTVTEAADNPFAGRTVVVTGTLVHFTRNTINAKIESLGAKAGSSVSKNTDYLICGESAGSKLDKARELGVPVLTEQQFLEMAG